MALHPDGRHLVITNNGWSKPSLRVVDLERRQVIQKMALDHAWLGVAWHPDGKRLFSSGAADNSIREVEWRGEKLVPGRTFALAPPQKGGRTRAMENPGFVGGLALSPDARVLYAAQVYGKAVAAVDVETGDVLARAALQAEAYAAAVPSDGSAVYVSVWGASRVAVLEPRTLGPSPRSWWGSTRTRWPSRRTRSASSSPAPTRTPCGSWTSRAAKAVEQIGVALSPQAPPGSTPNALALSADGATLLVANADNNTVAVVDVTRPGESRFQGFIPTGWYPTGVAFDPSGKSILVLSGKGLAAAANPRGPTPVAANADAQYIGGLLNGALSVVPAPDRRRSRTMTARVFAISAYNEGRRLEPPGRPEGSPVPGRVGDPSPIKHVFYVIRENRTYDQVLGDMPRGNGDPNLTLFGEDVTPNAHAIAQRVRPLRQLLRGRRGQQRRPRLLDRGLRDRRGREALADALRPARRHLHERGRPRDPQQLRQPRRPRRRLHLGLRDPGRGLASAATASSPRGRRGAARSRPPCPASSARSTPPTRPTTSRSPTTSAWTCGSRSSGASRRRAGSRASTSSASATTTPRAPGPGP